MNAMILGMSIKPYKRENKLNTHRFMVRVYILSVGQPGARIFNLTFLCCEAGVALLGARSWLEMEARQELPLELSSKYKLGGEDRLQVCLGACSVFRWSPQ